MEVWLTFQEVTQFPAWWRIVPCFSDKRPVSSTVWGKHPLQACSPGFQSLQGHWCSIGRQGENGIPALGFQGPLPAPGQSPHSCSLECCALLLPYVPPAPCILIETVLARWPRCLGSSSGPKGLGSSSWSGYIPALAGSIPTQGHAGGTGPCLSSLFKISKHIPV